MYKTLILSKAILLSLCCIAQQQGDWTNYTRIAGHGLNKNNIEATIKDAQDTHLFGIEVDNDIPGRYNSFLDPTEKLNDIRQLADRAHAVNNRAFVYIAGLECITANADKTQHSFFKDHPNWVQRDINNRPAVFGGGDAFWITKGDEDVWISPYAKEWRTRYMEQVRQIAATGIDGIYVDIPYWMTHFEGWGNTWASFDDYTIQAFKDETGLDAKKDLKLGDFKDANFRRWIDFRIKTLTAFMAEIDSNAKSVNPECKTIAEIYPGIGEEAVRVGADVYDMYAAVDAIAHEFSGGGGNAASQNPLNWFDRMVGMYTFRAFAGNKGSWMLSYSWDKENKVKPQEPMKNLALSNVMAGTNNYDAARHVMSGSNDYTTRTLINRWVEKNENTLYNERSSMSPVGIYFSPKTRDYFAKEFMESYQGVVEMMLQGHLEFEIVTPRTLSDFQGKVLILPDVKCLAEQETTLIENHIKAGNGLVITGETGKYDETGAVNKTNPVLKMLRITQPGAYTIRIANKYILYPSCPGKAYSKLLKNEFNKAAWNGSFQGTNFFHQLKTFRDDLLKQFNIQRKVKVQASPFISSQITSVNGRPHVFLANFRGLKSDAVVNQIPEKNVTITFIAKPGSKVYYLPFLGNKQQLNAQRENGALRVTLPPVAKGAVVWVEDTSANYYSVSDFSRVKKIDTHIHLNTLQETFVKQASADNLHFLDIVDDRPFGIPMQKQEEIAVAQTNKFPLQIQYATTFSTKRFGEKNWEEDAIASLKRSFENGAIAVKVWKNVGMALKDSDSNFVMVDDSRFDRLFSFLEENNIPLIGHLGEPRECWLPLEQMVLHKGYYAEHPEYHMYLHPEYPSYEKQVAARDNLLKKHPRLKFIGAHLGSLEWSLDELSKRLDAYPNMAVDLARMSDLYLHAKNNWQKTREFFIKYQDRLLYATDVQVNETKDTATYNKRIHDARIKYWMFFATDKQMSEQPVGEFRGLHLPKSVIDKIYFHNARQWLPGFDKG